MLKQGWRQRKGSALPQVIKVLALFLSMWYHREQKGEQSIWD